MKKKITYLTFSALILLVGCSSNTAKEIPFQELNAQKQPLDPIAVSDDQIPDESGSLTLAKALALTLRGSPELQSFSYNIRIAESRYVQAGLRPNPEISVGVEDVLGSGDYSGGREAQTTLLLSQIIELGGKRSARQEVATAFQSQVKDEYEIARVEVLSDVTDKFIRTVTDEQLLKLAERASGLAKDALINIQKRALAGGVSDLEETKAKVLYARSNIATEHAKHQLAASKRELSSLWGSDSIRFSSLDANLFQTIPLPSLEDIERRIDESLEIKKWVSEKRLREAEVKLAEAKSISNFAFGAGPRRFEGSDDNAWVFQVSMPLNIFDSNQAGISEAKSLKEQSSVNEQKARLRLRAVLFGLYQELQHSLTEIKAMKDEIIPQAEKSLKVAQEGYNQGRFSYLELLDTQKTLLEVYREQIEAAYSFHHYTNAIERLLGTPINTKTINKS